MLQILDTTDFFLYIVIISEALPSQPKCTAKQKHPEHEILYFVLVAKTTPVYHRNSLNHTPDNPTAHPLDRHSILKQSKERFLHSSIHRKKKGALTASVLTSVDRRVDNDTHWINLYLMRSIVRFVDTYLLDSDLSVG